VLSTPFTRVVFRIGDADARALESGFSNFAARDLQNLGTGENVCRLARSDFDFNLTIPLPPPADLAQEARTRQEVITASRKKYATPRADIEEAMQKRHESPEREAPLKAAPRQEKAPIQTPPPATPPIEPTPKVSPPLPDTGRGGAQHKSIQDRIKALAEELGYLATKEKSILDNRGSVDLALEKANRKIACEITITTTTDHEFGNVTKCLKAGFDHVAVISSKPERLVQITDAVNGALPKEEAKRVGYYSVEAFITHLRTLALEDAKLPPPVQGTRVSRGYKVNRSSVKLTAQEAKAREETAIKLVAAAMKKTD
jgi:hypothetical protein